MNWPLFSIFFLLFSCSRGHTLGTKAHIFGKKAKHIVWIQVDGLDDEHIALVKFARESAVELTPLEQMSCTGSMWDYNLFNLRPEPIESFMSQILGSQKIKGDCSDLDRSAVWNYFERSGYKVGVLEGRGDRNQSLLKYDSCNPEKPFLEDSYFWSQSMGAKNSKRFHFQEKMEFESPGKFFDKSCQEGQCFVSLKSNVTKIWPAMTKKFSKTFFVIRQSEYREMLLDKDILGARKSLEETMAMISFFLPKALKGDISLVVTSGSPQKFEFPESGKEWASFEDNGSNVLYKRPGLLAKAWSAGPGAEHFCGTYEASDILRRFIWTPDKNVLYFSF